MQSRRLVCEALARLSLPCLAPQVHPQSGACGLGRGREHRARYTVERDRETHDEVKYIAFRPERPRDAHCHALSSDLRAYTRVGSFIRSPTREACRLAFPPPNDAPETFNRGLTVTTPLPWLPRIDAPTSKYKTPLQVLSKLSNMLLLSLSEVGCIAHRPPASRWYRRTAAACGSWVISSSRHAVRLPDAPRGGLR